MESQVKVTMYIIYSYNLKLLYYLQTVVRLVGGKSYDEGRVEVYYNGQWSTVCNYGWDDTDASVVCKQLGFGSSGTAILDAQVFGSGTGVIFLSSVQCSHNDTTLSSCGHLGVTTTMCRCDHYRDAGVSCNSTYVCLYTTA